MNEIDFILEQLKGLTAIDSPTGFTEYAAEHVMNVYKKMGYAPVQTAKGGIFIDLGGKNEEDAILLTAHMDTLGAMVHTVKSNGRLKLTPLGGLNPNNTEGENCRIYTRSGRIYDGTFQLIDASIHVNGEYNDTKRSFDTMEVVLDEDVYNKEGVEALGVNLRRAVAAQQFVFEEDAHFGHHRLAVGRLGCCNLNACQEVFLAVRAQLADGQL